MKNPAVLYPVFVLAAWTLMVLLRVAYVRITSRLRPDEFKLGESGTVPERVCIPNRNYMNLLELPMLFYVASLILYMSGSASPTAQMLCWLYVALRIVHSLIHLSYNKVLHRLTVFALSNVTLAVLWTCTFQALSASAGH
jgi:hypothetical protein